LIPLSFAQLADGARASARFNVTSHAARKMPGPLAFSTLKRRERRAPLALAVGHPVSRSSIIRCSATNGMKITIRIKK
jgi:hypothetical protein